jgi:hypothetical protein
MARTACAGEPGQAGGAQSADPAPGGPTLAPDAEQAAIEQLLAQFAAVPGLEARFREHKRIALLDEPLVSEGTLRYAPPDRLLRRVERPVSALLLLRGEQLWLDGPQGPRSIELGTEPALDALVQGFVRLLRGDGGALREHYALALAQTGADWRLRLTPRPGPLAAGLAWLELAGRGGAPRQLRVRERSGDESVTEFFEVDSARHYSTAEREELFRAPAP